MTDLYVTGRACGRGSQAGYLRWSVREGPEGSSGQWAGAPGRAGSWHAGREQEVAGRGGGGVSGGAWVGGGRRSPGLLTLWAWLFLRARAARAGLRAEEGSDLDVRGTPAAVGTDEGQGQPQTVVGRQRQPPAAVTACGADSGSQPQSGLGVSGGPSVPHPCPCSTGQRTRGPPQAQC